MINVSGDPIPLQLKTSGTLKGTPGTPNTLAPAPQIEISEVMADNVAAASNGGVFSNYVELHNTTANAVNLAGWTLVSDAFSFLFPAGSTIGPNEYAIVWDDNLAAAPGSTRAPARRRSAEAADRSVCKVQWNDRRWDTVRKPGCGSINRQGCRSLDAYRCQSGAREQCRPDRTGCRQSFHQRMVGRVA
jgi:hypothetical protein